MVLEIRWWKGGKIIIKLEINEPLEYDIDIVKVLRHIASVVECGYRSSTLPKWELTVYNYDPTKLEDQLKMFNTPSHRFQLLESILHMLQEDLLSHEEKRKAYYEGMNAYYSVDRPNSNYAEGRWECELVKSVEAAFVDAMNNKELSEPGKEQIRKERFLAKTQFEQVMGDFRGIDWFKKV